MTQLGPATDHSPNGVPLPRSDFGPRSEFGPVWPPGAPPLPPTAPRRRRLTPRGAILAVVLVLLLAAAGTVSVLLVQQERQSADLITRNADQAHRITDLKHSLDLADERTANAQADAAAQSRRAKAAEDRAATAEQQAATSPADTSFLGTVRPAFPGVTDALLIGMGHETCQGIGDAGGTQAASDATIRALEGAGLSDRQATTLVQASVVAYCPQYH